MRTWTIDSLLQALHKVDQDATVFARRPWTPSSECILIGGPNVTQHSGREQGYAYFLEVFVILELFQSELVQSLAHTERVAGVIHYAEYDGWPT